MSSRNKDASDRLARLFSATVFRALSTPSAPEMVRSIIKDSGVVGLGRRMRLSRLFDLAYERLMESYRSEYFYKNAITNQILLGRHTLEDGPRAARMLTEFWAGDARVDIGVINGTSTAYEIKTELDKLDRLANQLAWYSKVFDRIYVVTANEMVHTIAKVVPQHVGIMSLCADGRLIERVKAKSNKSNIDLRVLFRAMREMEVLDICHRRFGIDPRISNGVRLEECWRVFKCLDPEDAHDLMVGALRQRVLHPAQRALIEAAPSSLKANSIGKRMNVVQYGVVLKQLEAIA